MAGCPYPVPQGSQAYLTETARALRGLGHEVALCVYGYGVGEPPADLRVHRGAAWGACRTAAGPYWRKPLLDVSLWQTLRRTHRAMEADVVAAHNYEGLFIALTAGTRPVLYFAHNALLDELPHHLRRAHTGSPTVSWPGRVGAWLDRVLPCRADAVVTPQQRLADYLIASGCAADRVTVVPPPIDASPFGAPEVADLLPAVFYTGNLDSYQNFALLEAAMARVRARLPDTRLLIQTGAPPPGLDAEVFPDPGFDALKRIIAEDVVVAVPRVSWSGYPIKLLNAMAAGRPVVICASAAHGLTDGVDALVVADNDAEAFSLALIRLLQDPALRLRIGLAARQCVLTRHRPELVGEQLSSIAAKTLARFRPG